MRAFPLLVSLALLSAIFITQSGRSSADLPPTEGGLTIDGYYGDLVRSEDHLSLLVTETYFYINSGNGTFAGNMTMWMQQGASVSVQWCNYRPNEVVRFVSLTEWICFPLEAVSSGVFKFRPFSGGDSLSFFGENHTIILNATSRNTTASNQLDFNVTLGSLTKASASQMALGNITMNATAVQLGAAAMPTFGLPRNLTIQQAVNISNTGGMNETVDLHMLGVPPGWAASVHQGGSPVNSVTLLAGRYTNLVLNLTAPSYMMHIYVEYTLSSTGSSGDAPVIFEKLFPYNTTLVSIWLTTLKNDNVTLSGGFQLHTARTWNETAQRYRYIIVGGGIKAGDVSTIAINWVPPPFVIPLWVLVALAVLLGLLVGYPLWRRTRLKAAKEDEETEAPTKTGPSGESPPSPTELRERKETLTKTLDRLELDEKDGHIPNDLAASMKEEVRAELADVEEQLGSLRTIETRKKAILKALRKLERDHKDGTVDNSVYTSLKARYEAEALKILKQIDELKGAESGRSDKND